MINETEGRAIRLTTSGIAIGRDTRLAGFSIMPAANDLVVRFRNGGSGSEILWSAEADASAGSHGESFDPPLRFKHGIYVEFTTSNANQEVYLLVIEPVE